MQSYFFLEHPSFEKKRKRHTTKSSMTKKTMSAENCESSSVESAPLTSERKFAVRVCDVGPRERVFVTGSSPELGEWRHERMVPLTPQGGAMWTKTVTLQEGVEVSYRYCIGVTLEEPNFTPLVRRWETNITPRHLSTDDREDTFGEYNGISKISRGWLTTDTLVQFKLFNNPLKLKSRLAGRVVNVKVTPIVLALGGESGCPGTEDPSASADEPEAYGGAGAYVEVATLNDKECEVQAQGQFGRTYRPDDVLLVNVWVARVEGIAFLIDVYAWAANASTEEAPCHVGYAYLLPDMLRRSEGRLELPITCGIRHRPLGSVRLEYLVVHPMPESLCDLRVSYAKHWDPSWTGLEVGHRGLGASFKAKEGTEIRENTIASLKRAAASGADLLEFDVQLSRDMVPVIYHDFYVCISMRRKKQIDYTDMLELPVKDLSLDQLQKLKVYHLVEGRSNEPRFHDEELEEHQPFPTLQAVLAALDPHVGFNVELKWTMERCDGTFELNNPFDMNIYVDKVYHLVEGRSNEPRFHDEELEEHQPFPTLQAVLAALDPHVGFNVELKWTMERCDGTFELNNPFDMNIYVDKVLEVLLKHAGERRIIISCFNPDICTVVRYKQNKYPVMFLTQGVTEKYPRYRDVRCQSTPAAVRHALSADILGVVAHTEDLLRDPTQVKLATDAGLVIFCWGDDNNNSDTIRRLKEMGLHAVIYDKLDQFSVKEVKESIFLVEARESQRALLCAAAGAGGAACAGGAGGAGGPASDPRLPLLLQPPVRLLSTATSLESLAPLAALDINLKRTSQLIAGVEKELQHKQPPSSFGLLASPVNNMDATPSGDVQSHASSYPSTKRNRKDEIGSEIGGNDNTSKQ